MVQLGKKETERVMTKMIRKRREQRRKFFHFMGANFLGEPKFVQKLFIGYTRSNPIIPTAGKN